MATSTLLDRTLRDESAEANDALLGRSAMVHLVKEEGGRKFVDLSWNVGAYGSQRGRTVRKILEAGQSMAMPLERAFGHFGPFTIPADLEEISDERKRKDLRDFFREQRAFMLLKWGDYPRPRRLSEGTDPTGPHRMPHIIVTVLDADNAPIAQYDLHEVYGVGEFDAENLRPSHFASLTVKPEDVIAAKDAEISELRSMLSAVLKSQGELEGKVSVLLSDRKNGSK